MYAIFARRSIIYLGEDQTQATEIMAEKGNDSCSMVMAATLPALHREFQKYLDTHPETGVDPDAQSAEDEAVEAVNHLFDKLDEAGINAENINATIERAKASGNDVLERLRSGARQGVFGLGNCLKQLGEFLQENSECSHNCAEECESDCTHEHSEECHPASKD